MLFRSLMASAEHIDVRKVWTQPDPDSLHSLAECQRRPVDAGLAARSSAPRVAQRNSKRKECQAIITPECSHAIGYGVVRRRFSQARRIALNPLKNTAVAPGEKIRFVRDGKLVSAGQRACGTCEAGLTSAAVYR